MRIELTGTCTTAQAGELVEQFLQALASREETVVSFGGLEEVDLSFFQILYSARLSFAAEGVALKFLSDIPMMLAFKASKSGWGNLLAADE